MKRITPLNILTAFILLFVGLRLIDRTLEGGLAGWLLLAVVISLVADQYIRVALVTLRKIWMAQLILITLCAGIAWAVWYFNN
jgi:hypothetical protein